MVALAGNILHVDKYVVALDDMAVVVALTCVADGPQDVAATFVANVVEAGVHPCVRWTGDLIVQAPKNISCTTFHFN